MFRQNCKQAQVEGLKEPPITIRRCDDLGLVSPLRSFEQVAPYCPQRLLSQSATLYEKSVQVCRRTKHKIESPLKAKEKYRGVFEIQKSGDKTSSGEIGLDIRTHASPKVGQDQVSGGVSVLCWHAAPVAFVPWKPCTNDHLLILSRSMRLTFFSPTGRNSLRLWPS